jgi:hypothetical protein
MKKIIFFTLLLTASYANTQAQQSKVVMSDKTGWHKMGGTVVDFTTESDEILVVGADRFSAIQMKVTEAPIELLSFDIYFESGDKQTVTIGELIASPGETRIIQLDGGERSIKKVVFIHKTIPNYKDKKAMIELWGLKTNPDKKAKK